MVNLKSTGRFAVTVFDSEGNEKVEKRKECLNTVTNSGVLHAVFDGYNNDRSLIFGPYGYIVIGQGTEEITKTSTQLGNPLSTKSSSFSTITEGAWLRSGEVDNEDGTSTISVTYRGSFTLGAVVGTISEVGLELNREMYTGVVFTAGQLIKDEFGNPTTVTILSDEQLIVDYTIEWTVTNSYVLAGSGTVTLSDNTEIGYRVYAPPYFMISRVGGESDSTDSRESNVVAAVNRERYTHAWVHYANGGKASYNLASNPIRTVDNVENRITYRMRVAKFPPSVGALTGIHQIHFGHMSTASYSTPIDAGTANTVVPPNSQTTAWRDAGGPVVVFDTPFDKSETENFEIAAELVYQL